MRLLALALLAACGGDFVRRPYQDQAEQIVWRETYGRTDAAPPVEWVHDTKVFAGYAGTTLIGWKVRVACRFPGNGPGDCDLPVVFTGYAHELYHWFCWLKTGDVDIGHRHCDWTIERAAEDKSQARWFASLPR